MTCSQIWSGAFGLLMSVPHPAGSVALEAGTGKS